MKTFAFLILFLVTATFGRAQEQLEQIKVKPFISTGYGYYNQDFLLDGTSLMSEIGLKLPNGYVFSVQFHLASNENTIGSWPPLAELGLDFDLIYSQRILSILTGYEIVSCNQRHTVTPIIGPFYCCKKNARPSYDDQYFYGTKIEVESFLGFAPGLRYSYNFKNGISVGVNSSFYFAMHYGLFSYSVMPIIAFRLR